VHRGVLTMCVLIFESQSFTLALLPECAAPRVDKSLIVQGVPDAGSEHRVCDSSLWWYCLLIYALSSNKSVKVIVCTMCYHCVLTRL